MSIFNIFKRRAKKNIPLQAIVDLTGELVVVFDEFLTVTYANRSFLNVYIQTCRVKIQTLHLGVQLVLHVSAIGCREKIVQHNEHVSLEIKG